MSWPQKVKVFTDGACRGNPGPASIGVFITDPSDESVLEFGERIGETTNNVAEYSAVKKALEICREQKVKEVLLFSDSELLIKQLNGEYKVKSPMLIDLFWACKAMLKDFDKVTFTHVRREYNKMADQLANMALDRRI